MMTKHLFRTLIITTIVVLTIYYAQVLVMPIIFSGLCAMFVHPLVKRFEKMGLGLVFSSLIVVVVVTTLIVVVVSLFILQGIDIVKTLPVENVESLVENPIHIIDKQIDLDLKNYSANIKNLTKSAQAGLISFVLNTLLNINSAFIFLISCPLYIFFMLISRSAIHKFYYSCFQQSKKSIANRILSQIELTFINYLKGVGYVVLIISTLTSLGLYFIGIEYALFIGVLSGFMTLIPYVGVIISALIPITIALLTKDSWWYTGGVVLLYAVVQFLEGNIITPKIMGNKVGINPLIVIVGIVIFGAIGGVVGMVITIPVLVLIKVVSAYIPGWKPLRNLLRA